MSTQFRPARLVVSRKGTDERVLSPAVFATNDAFPGLAVPDDVAECIIESLGLQKPWDGSATVVHIEQFHAACRRRAEFSPAAVAASSSPWQADGYSAEDPESRSLVSKRVRLLESISDAGMLLGYSHMVIGQA